MKTIKGFENYAIDEDGVVIRKARVHEYFRKGKKVKRAVAEKIKAVKLDRYGYFHLGLAKDNKYHFRTIHRLVALNFIPNPNNKPVVNHIDGDKQNNNVSNLEWCTVAENTNHAFANGLIIPKNGCNYIPKDNTSGYVGISFVKSGQRRKRWGSSLYHQKKRVMLGNFKHKHEAVGARNNYIVKNNLEHLFKIQKI